MWALLLQDAEADRLKEEMACENRIENLNFGLTSMDKYGKFQKSKAVSSLVNAQAMPP